MAKRMAEQMELFEPVERGFNEGGDTSSAKDAAMQDLQSSAADKKAARQDQFDKLTDMLMSGEIKDMPEEQQQKFIKLYKMMKSQGFNEGGLMEEGGMVDEESGNEVPPGSLREEVRDDIPAQLSEGEFVFPADVVRYIGLENLMRMRQEAKQGLSQMEAMGQMGNSEEAVVQDDLPFDMYDLDIDDEEEYNSETRNYQVGGYVPPSVPQQPYNQPTQVDPRTGTYTLPGTGIAGYQVPSGTPTGYTPYGGAQPYFQPVQFTGAQYQTALQTTNLPTFAETVGSKPGQYDELRTYINDAGQTLQIPFKDGRPIYPIPEGYRPIGDQPAPEEEQVTVTPTLGETTVRDDGGRDDDGGYQGATVALGGTSGTGKQEGLRVGSTVVGVSYNMPNVGLGALPGLAGGFAKAGQFATSGLPETSTDVSPGQPGYNPGGTASFFDTDNPKASVTVTAEDFNNMKADGFKGALAESYRSAVNAVSAVRAGDINAYNNLSTDRLGPSGKSAKDLADAATVKGLMDKVDINNPQGIVDNLKNAFTGTFAEAVDKLNDAERSVLEGMGVDLDDSLDISATEKAALDKQTRESMAAAVAAANKAKAEKARAEQQKAMRERQKAEAEAEGFTAFGDYSQEGKNDQTAGDTGPGGSGEGIGTDDTGSTGRGTGTDCLTEKMKVKLNGAIDFVTNIKVGDIIDGSVVKEVLHKHMRSGYFVINNELEITNDHPVLANGTWTKPEELYIGDYINDVKVKSIKYIDRMTPTVSIVIDSDSFDVYTEGNTYTVHGRYREVRQQAA